MAEHAHADPAGAPVQVLDALRGLAATYVMVGHARQYLWGGTRGLTGVGLLMGRASGLLNFGHKSVILFFVISGFCIHFRQAPSPGAASVFSLVAFARRRARRLLPPLALALALTLVFDRVASSISPARADVGDVGHEAVVILGNLAMQADFLVPHFGSNVPLWSLAYEFWFYAAYPALLLAVARAGMQRAFYIVATVSALGLVCQLLSPSWPASAVSYWVIWVAGALLAEDHFDRARVPRPAIMLAGLAAVGGVWWLSKATVAADLAVAVVYVLALTYLLDGNRGTRVALARSGLLRLAPLGAISYSLYLVHVPLLAVMRAAWLNSHLHLPSSPWLALAGVAASLLLGVTAYASVERHFVSRGGVRDMAAP
jgi:peptidoglycan/LPS O-acetylase OafA/YrhL